MKRESRFLKAILPIFTVAYSVLIVTAISVLNDRVLKSSVVGEIILYLLSIALTYLFIIKVETHFFSETSRYEIGKTTLNNIIAICLCMMGYYILRQKLLSMVFFARGGQIHLTNDIETIPEILILSLSSVFLAPVFEELAFRFMGLSAYKSASGKLIALLVLSSLFAALHFHSPYSALGSFIDGCIYGILFILSKQVIIPILAHIAYNAATTILCVLYNLQTPGILINDNPTIIVFGQKWIILSVMFIFVGLIILIIDNRKKI